MGRAFPTPYPDSLNMVSQSWVGTEDLFLSPEIFFFFTIYSNHKGKF